MSPDVVRALLVLRLVVGGIALTAAGAVDGIAVLSALGVLVLAGAAVDGLARFAHRSGPAPVRRMEAQLAL